VFAVAHAPAVLADEVHGHVELTDRPLLIVLAEVLQLRAAALDLVPSTRRRSARSRLELRFGF